MQDIQETIEKMNLPISLKEKMNTFINNQQRNNSKESKSYLTKKYDCEECRDLSFIIIDNTAIPCKCRDIKEAKSILALSGVSEEFRNKTFDNFNYSYDTQIIDAYYKAYTYYKKFKDIKSTRQNSIVFMGQSGAGKTHLSVSVLNKLIDDSVAVIYMSYRDNITQIKQNILNEEYYNKIMNKYKKAKVLLIDDLYKGNITKSDINIIFEIVNYRYFNNLPMIISTEKTFEELIDIDEAVGSRIIEMSKDYLVKVEGKHLNYRIYG